MNVLLIGDSIRMFYQEEVQTNLSDTFSVYAPKVNCRFSAFVLNSLRFWLTENPPADIIHFNAGLWDTAILYSEDGCFVDLESYISNMKKIIRVLKTTGAELIFATSTPVCDEKQYLPGPMPPAHKNADIAAYNAAAVELMKQENIPVNDLFSLMYADKEKYLSEDMIHPNEEGVKFLGQAVAQAIRNCSATMKHNPAKTAQKLAFAENTTQEKTIQ